MGLIGTRSVDQADSGHPGDQGQEPRAHRARHRGGDGAGGAAQEPRTTRRAKAALRARTRPTWASACCSRRYTADVAQATPEMIDKAVNEHGARGGADVLGLPRHGRPGLRDARRCSAWPSGAPSRRPARRSRWLLKWALWMLPAPWIACELGWYRRRVRPPAMDHLRRAADAPERLDAWRGQPVRLAGRLHRLLHACCWWSRST